jgi:ribose 5-phosphate isomerase A
LTGRPRKAQDAPGGLERRSILDLKRDAGEAAAGHVESGMVVGLGTGSTAVHFIASLGERLRSGRLRDVRGVPTSFDAGRLAREQGIPVISLDDTERIDLAVDGADEIDPNLDLIKGGGAAHTREKIVDACADRFIVIADRDKLVDRLGRRSPVPVEVLPFALAPVSRRLRELGGAPELRMGQRKAGPVVTDQGNFVLDVRFEAIHHPGELERELDAIPGVLACGLFVGLAHLALIGDLVDGAPRVRELVRHG